MWYINRWVLRIHKQMTGTSRGCAFITYCKKADSDRAIAGLHDARTLPGMQHSMQVKVADSEKGKEANRKLFGMHTSV